ncbi:ArsC/Spx/MgsR family protein [Lactococcus garvieae]|uniref:ArsC/Spx/MgsR family protein n=1 Tax=Lactococcus garvieae TaxID=1363 RepID=UPI00398F6D8E
MIYLYCRRRCISSIKAIQWFNKYGLKVCVKFSGQISREELITVLASTDKGISDLLKHHSHCSDVELSKHYLIKKMKLNQAIDYIKVNPTLLKSPIIIENNKVLIGFNQDQIRIFLAKVYRRKSLLNKIKGNTLL